MSYLLEKLNAVDSYKNENKLYTDVLESQKSDSYPYTQRSVFNRTRLKGVDFVRADLGVFNNIFKEYCWFEINNPNLSSQFFALDYYNFLSQRNKAEVHFLYNEFLNIYFTVVEIINHSQLDEDLITLQDMINKSEFLRPLAQEDDNIFLSQSMKNIDIQLIGDISTRLLFNNYKKRYNNPDMRIVKHFFGCFWWYLFTCDDHTLNRFKDNLNQEK